MVSSRPSWAVSRWATRTGDRDTKRPARCSSDEDANVPTTRTVSPPPGPCRTDRLRVATGRTTRFEVVVPDEATRSASTGPAPASRRTAPGRRALVTVTWTAAASMPAGSRARRSLPGASRCRASRMTVMAVTDFSAEPIGSSDSVDGVGGRGRRRRSRRVGLVDLGRYPAGGGRDHDDQEQDHRGGHDLPRSALTFSHDPPRTASSLNGLIARSRDFTPLLQSGCADTQSRAQQCTGANRRAQDTNSEAGLSQSRRSSPSTCLHSPSELAASTAAGRRSAGTFW